MQKAYGEIKPVSILVATRATANLSDPGGDEIVHAIQFQALENNTGGVLICSKAAVNIDTDVFHRIPPRTNGVDFAWSVGAPPATGGLHLGEYYILPEVTTEGVRITGIQL